MTQLNKIKQTYSYFIDLSEILVIVNEIYLISFQKIKNEKIKKKKKDEKD